MDPILKRRLIGASILIALAVIFLPMLLVGPESDELGSPDDFDLPPMPDQAREVRRIPLDPEAARVTNTPTVDAYSDRRASRGAADPAGGEVETESPIDPASDVEVSPASNQIPEAQPSLEAQDDAAAVVGDVASNAATEPEDEIVLRPELVADQQDQETRSAAPADDEPVAVASTESAQTESAVREPAPRADAEGNWVVQVASFGSAESADQVQSRLDALGHPVLRDELVRGEAVLHRLQTGPYSSEAQAATALAQIKATVAGVEPVLREIEAGSATEPSAGFAVQVGSFVSPDNAQTETDRLLGLDFEAFRFSETVGEREVWRVMVGPVDTRAAAEALKSRVDDQAGVAGLVVSLP